MKRKNLLQAMVVSCMSILTTQFCNGGDRIKIKNPYRGMADFSDVATSIPQFRLFLKGGEFAYPISDWTATFDFELNRDHTIEWRFAQGIPIQNRRYVLYPSWWNGDQLQYPEILCMRGNRLLNRVREEIKTVTDDDYWRTEYYFKNYYELVKRFHGEKGFPFDRINDLKLIEETARLTGISLIRTGLQEDQREKIVTNIQSWNGWMLTAVVKDEGGGIVTDYHRQDSAKDEVLQQWLLEVLLLRIDSAHKNYVKNRSSDFPDRTVKELCDEHPRISKLLLFDAEFFHNHVYEEPWCTLLKEAIKSRPEPIQAVCNELLFETNYVSSANPISGNKINLYPVFGQGDPPPGHQIHEEMRLAALELAVSMLLGKK